MVPDHDAEKIRGACRGEGRQQGCREFRLIADTYNQAVESAAGTANGISRAYYDDGALLGSSESDDCKIDSIAQSWSVISHARFRSVQRAMKSLNEQLVREDARLLMLLTPPFDSSHDPGYIQGYLPGVRENGAQYTHAASGPYLQRRCRAMATGRCIYIR